MDSRFYFKCRSKGYADGMEFTWEFPVRDEKLINNEGAETTTSYYPQENLASENKIK